MMVLLLRPSVVIILRPIMKMVHLLFSRCLCHSNGRNSYPTVRLQLQHSAIIACIWYSNDPKSPCRRRPLSICWFFFCLSFSYLTTQFRFPNLSSPTYIASRCLYLKQQRPKTWLRETISGPTFYSFLVLPYALWIDPMNDSFYLALLIWIDSISQ